MYYFTSDLHLGHTNVLQWREGFSSIDEMDEVLVDNWNKRVRTTDTVIIAGDLFFHNKRPAEEYLAAMKGKKILIRGNHDRSWMKKLSEEQICKYFAEVHDLYTLKKNGVRLAFCHYPMIAWNGSRKGDLLICGHIHCKREGFEYELFRQVPTAFNAGVDVNHMAPATLGELIENNAAFYGRGYTDEDIALLRSMGEAFDNG